MPSPVTTQLKRWLTPPPEPAGEAPAAPLPLRARAILSAARSRERLRELLRKKYGMFVLLVLLPTALFSFYELVMAADQYQSEAHYFIYTEGGNSQSSSSSGGGGALSTGSPSASVAATMAVVDYLKSHDASRDAEKTLDLVGMYRRPEADFFSRVENHPSAEHFDRYLFDYFGYIDSYVDSSEGVAVLKVRAFRPDDAQAIASAMLDGADKLVDRFGQRIQEDTLKVAHSEVDRAEQRVTDSQAQLTAFRIREGSVDPTKAAQTVLEVVGKLEDQLSQAQAQLVGATTYLQPGSPRYDALTNQVNALKAQIATERARLTGHNGSMTPTLGAYERLTLQQDFAQKDYEAALGGLEQARIQADRQHMYLVQVVQPNTPEEAEFPRTFFNIFTVLVTLCVTYGIGWLIVAGVREHAG